MSVMTRFVSFVSLNHPGVLDRFHGPIPIAACQSTALGLYPRCLDSSRDSAPEIYDLVLGQTTCVSTFSTPHFCLFCHKPLKGKSQANQKAKRCRGNI
ncbi:uncharacterized protein N7518_009778 [Penicillium psychrosexuale]|uniref:uncharacterized protein n=1 Tax=Penicillium psychrosexuale TaxID=1002107 RepID=UPI002545A4BE|nr:uncharacterized protein N7518_009778 [Penicillium psychrosexuale]KAJ5784101.1 hypothetical protein N7518_009778 [Penicillium psychrosexuale]